MKVNEIFYSIQGEGPTVGFPTVFLRLAGCNLRCSWCDTLYAQEPFSGKEMAIPDIIGEVSRYYPAKVCITGGEPLLQEEELGVLFSSSFWLHYRITVETNGSLIPPKWASIISNWVVDVKCPSSGVSSLAIPSWIGSGLNITYKFVVKDPQDLEWMEEYICAKAIFPKNVIVSPVLEPGDNFNSSWVHLVVEFCKRNNYRFGLQLHKVLWDQKRGV